MDAPSLGLPAEPAPSFRDWWAEFISTRVGVRPSTRLRDESIFRCHLEPFFGDVAIDRIGFRDAQRFVAELAATDLSPRTVRKAAGLLAQSLDIAVRSRLLEHNPTRGLSLPQVPHKEPTFLEPAEVERLADAIAAPYRTFVLVGAYAGLRNGELAALRAKRVHAATTTIDVTETRTLSRDGTPTFGPPKSRAGRRTVPVPSFVMEELVIDMASRGVEPDELIWTSPNGKPLGDANFRRRIWKPATEAAGLDGLRIHDLRHTCVAMWSRSLASPRAAAKWAGHSNPALILGVYGGVFDDESNAVMQRLSDFAAQPRRG
ncbi:MAG: tyrosine-type recombinase/integrase [Acidimicrobiales bacterium]